MSAANQTNELGTRNRQLTWWSANIVLTMLAMQLLLPTNAFAWGETGHRVVCQIAYDSLLPAARHELDRLPSVHFRIHN